MSLQSSLVFAGWLLVVVVVNRLFSYWERHCFRHELVEVSRTHVPTQDAYAYGPRKFDGTPRYPFGFTTVLYRCPNCKRSELIEMPGGPVSAGDP